MPVVVVVVVVVVVMIWVADTIAVNIQQVTRRKEQSPRQEKTL